MKFGIDKQKELNLIIDKRHPMKRKTSSNSSRQYEVAVKYKGGTFMEEYFLLPEEKRYSEYKVVVVSSKADLIFIDFNSLKNSMFPYPEFKEKFVEIARTSGDYDRHYNKIKTFVNHFDVEKMEKKFRESQKVKNEKILKKKKKSFSESKDKNQQSIVKKKPSKKRRKMHMSTGGYNTLLQGSGVKIEHKQIKEFNIEEKIAKSGAFNDFIKDKKNRISSFNLKNYLKTLKVEEMAIGSCFTKNFVVPPSNIGSIEKLEMISKSKRIHLKRMNTIKSKSMRRVGTSSSKKSRINIQIDFCDKSASKSRKPISKFQSAQNFYKKNRRSTKSYGGTPSTIIRKKFPSTVIHQKKERNLSEYMTKRSSKIVKRPSIGNNFYLSDFKYKKCEKKNLGIEGTRLPTFNRQSSSKKFLKRDTFISIV